MFVLDSLLLGGLKFVLGKIAAAVEAELDDETSLREELLAVQMKRELGEISEEDFAAVERALLDAIREVRARRRRGEEETDSALRVTGIEADVWSGHDGDEDETGRSGRS